MLNFCDFIQVYVFTTNHHLKALAVKICARYFLRAPDFRRCSRETEVGTIYSHESCTRPTRCTPDALGFKRVKWG